MDVSILVAGEKIVTLRAWKAMAPRSFKKMGRPVSWRVSPRANSDDVDLACEAFQHPRDVPCGQDVPSGMSPPLRLPEELVRTLFVSTGRGLDYPDEDSARLGELCG